MIKQLGEPRRLKYLRFRDLQEAGVITSWPVLRRRIDKDGFPKGILLGPNMRVWAEADVIKWLDGRPTALKAGPKGGRPKGAVRPRKRALESTATAS